MSNEARFWEAHRQWLEPPDPDYYDCLECDGKGYLMVADPDGWLPVKEDCEECEGEGRVEA